MGKVNPHELLKKGYIIILTLTILIKLKLEHN